MVVFLDTMHVVLSIIFAVAGLIIGGLIVFLIPVFRKYRADNTASKIIREAEIKAEHIQKNAKLDGKQAAFELKQEAEKEIKEKKSEIAALENKLSQREQGIDRRDAALI